MRFTIFLLTILFTTSFLHTDTSYGTSEEDSFLVYSTNQKTMIKSSKSFKYGDDTVTIYVGLDSNNVVSEVRVSGDISVTELAELRKSFSKGDTCVTRCSRENHCSDKPNIAGVIGCYAECVIDCGADLLEDLKEKDEDDGDTELN